MTGEWNDELQCYWLAWKCDGPRRVCLLLEDGACCDMAGAIKVAKRLMPNVATIQTYSGESKDTLYELRRYGWVALVAEISARSE